MKIIAGSDIHSNLIYANLFADKIIMEKPDKVILLGDLMENKDKKYFQQIFSQIKCPVWYVEGNCDRYCTDLGNIIYKGSYIIEQLETKNIFFTHGHLYNRYRMPAVLKENDIFIYGHLHTPFISVENNIIIANAGSVGAPRNGTEHSYLIIEDDKITIKEVEFNTIIAEKNI